MLGWKVGRSSDEGANAGILTDRRRASKNPPPEVRKDAIVEVGLRGEGVVVVVFGHEEVRVDVRNLDVLEACVARVGGGIRIWLLLGCDWKERGVGMGG